MIGRYFDACILIDNKNWIRQYGLIPEKYWVTQSGYFRLTNTVALGIGITDGKILFCHGITEKSVDKKFSASE